MQIFFFPFKNIYLVISLESGDVNVKAHCRLLQNGVQLCSSCSLIPQYDNQFEDHTVHAGVLCSRSLQQRLGLYGTRFFVFLFFL